MGKISLSNIAEELAVKGGLTREAANTFMHAFVETIEKGLKEDGIVKVKGLGTFKLQEMNDRDSVDVNTGERITIKGYRKVTFTPDSAMKELVNRPFAHFEPTELNDAYPDEEEPVVPDTLADEEGEAEAESETSAHAEEVADTTATVEVKESVEDVKASETIVEEEHSTEEFATEAETLSVVEPVEKVAEQDDAVEVTDTNVAEGKMDEQVVEDIEKRSEERSKTIDKKQRRGGCWWRTLLVLLLFIAGLYF
jgi:nucleoid DNA-binding protein